MDENVRKEFADAVAEGEVRFGRLEGFFPQKRVARAKEILGETEPEQDKGNNPLRNPWFGSFDDDCGLPNND